MNRSRTLSLLTAAALGTVALSSVAVAQQASPQPGAQRARPHMPQTRERATAKADRRFARLDTDRNGSVTQAEMRAAALARFQRVDTNNDGRIDVAERRAFREKRMERRAKRGVKPEASIHQPHTGG